MGNEFEVWSWELQPGSAVKLDAACIDDYAYVLKYAGEDRVKAMYTMEELKRNGAACIKFMWR